MMKKRRRLKEQIIRTGNSLCLSMQTITHKNEKNLFTTDPYQVGYLETKQTSSATYYKEHTHIMYIPSPKNIWR